MRSFLIGSLPHKSVGEALDYSFSFSIPTLPSLPKIDEDEFMVDQALREIDGYFYKGHNLRLGGPIYNTPLSFCAEGEFFKRLKPDEVFKWQACGPLTLQASLDHHPDTEKILGLYLEKVLLTGKRFKGLHPGPSIFFLDEPVLGFNEKNLQPLNHFLNQLKSVEQFKETLFGLHCCSKVAKGVLERLEFDLIALDPSLYSKEDYVLIQKALAKKLVHVACSSKGENIGVEKMDEEFSSVACGQALSSICECEAIGLALR